MYSFQNKNKYFNIQNSLNSIKACENISNTTLHLTANENVMSQLCQFYLTSNLSYRYHLEKPSQDDIFDKVILVNDFMLKRLSGVFELEKAAHQAAEKMFSSEWTDFRPTSGMNAMISVMMTATNPGDTIYLISHKNGGHTATVNAIQHLGRNIKFLPWDNAKHNIDLEKFQITILHEKPKFILFNQSDVLFPLPIKQIREISGIETLLIYDASHTQGLIAGNQFQSPLKEGCDILHGSTHKTFPGPQKGMIHFKHKSLGHNISEKIGKSVISSQHTHHSIALYIAMLEIAEFGEVYAAKIIQNARRLAHYLVTHGFNLFNIDGKYTDSHTLMLAFNSKESCHKACIKLHECNISTNARFISDKYYIRIGVQEITRLGMGDNEMELIALLIKKILLDNDSNEKIKQEVNFLKKKFNLIHFSFDQHVNFEELL